MLEVSEYKRIQNKDVRAMYYQYVALAFLDKELSYVDLKCLALMMYRSKKGMLLLDRECKDYLSSKLKISISSLSNRISGLVKEGIIKKEKREHYRIKRYFKIDEGTVIEIKNALL